jgi:hypothetical protein
MMEQSKNYLLKLRLETQIRLLQLTLLFTLTTVGMNMVGHPLVSPALILVTHYSLLLAQMMLIYSMTLQSQKQQQLQARQSLLT